MQDRIKKPAMTGAVSDIEKRGQGGMLKPWAAGGLSLSHAPDRRGGLCPAALLRAG